MTREKAIEWLEHLRDEEELNAKLFEISEHPRDMDNPHTPWVEMYEMAIGALREQLVTGCNQWISVEERLPENDYGKHWQERKQYLVFLQNGTMRVARYGYKEYDWWIGSQDVVLHENHYTGVTHWMPLPEPPEGGADRDD